jgi:hypothetical protein
MSVSSSSWNLTNLVSIYLNLLHGALVNQPSFYYFINLTHSLTDCSLTQSFGSKFLKVYSELPPTPLQMEEDLEQPKVLQSGYSLKVFWHGTLQSMR